MNSIRIRFYNQIDYYVHNNVLARLDGKQNTYDKKI